MLGYFTDTRGYLPHVKREGAAYFVTFRLADSLPQAVLLEFESERAERLHRFHAQHDAAKKLGGVVRITENLEDLERDFRRKMERYLDQGCGMCWLQRPEIADLVAGAIRFFAGQRYRLDAWVSRVQLCATGGRRVSIVVKGPQAIERSQAVEGLHVEAVQVGIAGTCRDIRQAPGR